MWTTTVTTNIHVVWLGVAHVEQELPADCCDLQDWVDDDDDDDDVAWIKCLYKRFSHCFRYR